MLTNAAGGIQGGLRVGQPVLIRDHLNLTGRSPLTGPPPPAGYPGRFTDLTDLYAPRLRTLARAADPGLAEGVYAALPGPHYETPAEISMLQRLGADLVGMSTALEAIAARHLGAEVLGHFAGLEPGRRTVRPWAGPRRGGRGGPGRRGPDGQPAGQRAARGQMTPGELTERARAWLADDPGPADRAELGGLLAAAGQPGPAGQAAQAELADRFAARLEFGTAGLRGAMGAGPNRMNRAVVRAATMGLARWLHERWPTAAQAGVVLGWDARHRSAEFAEEAAAVLTGAGIPVHLLPGRSPTPLLAFAVRHLAAGAGVMITASHNPPADNGYKLYLGDGAQIVPPVDAQIEAAIRELGPLSQARLGSLDGPLVTRHGAEIADAYLTAIVAAVPGPAWTAAVPTRGDHPRSAPPGDYPRNPRPPLAAPRRAPASRRSRPSSAWCTRPCTGWRAG